MLPVPVSKIRVEKSSSCWRYFLAYVSCLVVSCFFFLSSVQAQFFGSSSIVFPLMAPRISSNYGMRIHPIRKFSKKHNGIDLAAPSYSHVRAVAAGLVVYADAYKGFGNLVTIKHENGCISLYGHLDEVRVNPGTRVNAGDLIGRLGSTGMSTGPHLHFEWRVNGKPVDPLKVFPSLAEPASG